MCDCCYGANNAKFMHSSRGRSKHRRKNSYFAVGNFTLWL
jgi:hypothetical protein